MKIIHRIRCLINSWKSLKNVKSLENILTAINKLIPDTAEFRLIAMIFCATFVVACLLNIVAALMVWRWLLVPYIVLDFFRLCGFLAAHIVIMMIFKKQLNLGILIVSCSFGGFFILLLGYMWNCSVALFQIIGIVKSTSYRKIVSLGSPAPPKPLRNVIISTITTNSKPNANDLKMDKAAEAGMFASDFSEYYQRPSNFKF